MLSTAEKIHTASIIDISNRAEKIRPPAEKKPATLFNVAPDLEDFADHSADPIHDTEKIDKMILTALKNREISESIFKLFTVLQRMSQTLYLNGFADIW